jgi:hypothetical protein
MGQKQIFALFHSKIEKKIVDLTFPEGNLTLQDKNRWYRLFKIPLGQQWG